MKNFKKTLSMVAFLFVMSVATTQAPSVSAATSCSTSSGSFTSGKLCYNVTSSNTVTCTGLKSSCQNTTSVSVPSTVKCNGKTYNVTKVANSAFKNNDCLKSVKVSNSVKSIGKSCFTGCDSLKNVSLGSNVNSVGSNCFSSCSSLNTIKCGSTISSQGTNCFGNATCSFAR